jgi:uncharacterized protein (DUF1778 family)
MTLSCCHATIGLQETLFAQEYDMAHLETRTAKVEMRLTKSAKQLLQAAASASHRSVSEFVLESALARAEETLPDRKRFGLDKAHWKAFQEALDAPPRPSRRLAKLLREASVFERGGV